MKIRILILTLTLTLATLALLGHKSRGSETGTSTSEIFDQTNLSAPEFDLVNVAGGRTESADIKGKVAVIDFWATWCAPCIVEIPNFNDLHAEHKSNAVQMLAITVESGTLDKIKPKVAQFEMKYPVLVGDDKVVEGFGGQRGFPTTYVVTKDWKIYKRYLGVRANKKELIEKDIEKLLTQ
jgi:thiol-disulfide isomerase/thioredoxin